MHLPGCYNNTKESLGLKTDKLAILHFQPLEKYPPVMNWLNYLQYIGQPGLKIKVYTHRASLSKNIFKVRKGEMQISRFPSLSRLSWIRYLQYTLYYTISFFRLILWRPQAVLYYETLSAFPAIWYKKYINRRCQLLVHYHEYTSLAEHHKGMKVNLWANRLEKKSYGLCNWISHTNAVRLELFASDAAIDNRSQLRVLPNYPPKSWHNAAELKAVKNCAGPIRLIYVGALSLDTLFTKEVASWVAAFPNLLHWDIYSDNHESEALNYLQRLAAPNITFRGSVDYFQLPGILQNYDVGLILYKGHIPNFVYNAPNKLFEYLVCGLHVWYPQNMLGIHAFERTDTNPKIIGLDFGNLGAVTPSDLIGNSYVPTIVETYAYEDEYKNLFKAVVGE